MRWNLDRFYPQAVADREWRQDKERAISFVVQGEFEQAEKLLSFLWTYAYARYCLNTKDKLWKHRLNEVEEIEEKITVQDEEESDQKVEDAIQRQAEMIQEIYKIRFSGLTVFQASTSPHSEIRREAREYLTQQYAAKKERFAELLIQICHDKFPSDPHYLKARQQMLDALPLLQTYLGELVQASGKTKIHWTDLSFLFESEMNDWDSTYSLEQTRSLMGDLHSFFGETLSHLLVNGCLETSEAPHKLQSGFAMPVAFHHEPLCYLHSVRGKEGALGLLHELSHGLHFWAYRDQEKNYLLPDVSVVEIFPMTIELVALHKWEGRISYLQRILSFTLFQFLKVEFKYQIHEKRVQTLEEIQCIWDDLIEMIFGHHLEFERGTNLSWCGSRLVWQEAEVGQRYICGSVAAWNLSKAILDAGKPVLDRVVQTLALPPSCDLQAWNESLNIDLLGSLTRSVRNKRSAHDHHLLLRTDS